MNIKVWPFLVSRNSYLDYRTVVAPDFICEAKKTNILARAAEGELTSSGQGIIRNIIGSKVGDFTIVFRVIKAMEKDINPSGEDNVLKDQFGREIYIFEGIVVKGIKEGFTIFDRDFLEVHQRLATRYEKFWSLVNPTPPTSSQSFHLNMENTADSVSLKKLEPLDLNPKPLTSVSDSTSTAENIRPRKIPITLILTLISILMVAVVLVFGRFLFGKPVLLGCATTTLVKGIELEAENNKIVEKLNKLKGDYPVESNIYLSGSLEIEPSRKLENIESSNQDHNESTIKLSKEDNRLELNFHPIDLAIDDLINQKLSEDSEIELRVIDKSRCM